jgi:hypothetical protein
MFDAAEVKRIAEQLRRMKMDRDISV